MCVYCVYYRQLLWHGSRLSNWVGILSQGLRVAPPEAPVTGYMVRRLLLKPHGHGFKSRNGLTSPPLFIPTFPPSFPTSPLPPSFSPLFFLSPFLPHYPPTSPSPPIFKIFIPLLFIVCPSMHMQAGLVELVSVYACSNELGL